MRRNGVLSSGNPNLSNRSSESYFRQPVQERTSTIVQRNWLTSSQGDGHFELHVPQPFTEERPAILFSHSLFPRVIEEHFSGNGLPKPTEHASLQVLPDFRGVASSPEFPESFQDLLYSDTPPLSLHVASYQNATLVTIRYPHMLMDALGQRALIHAWSMVLSGNASQVPELLGTREDEISTLWSNLGTNAAKEKDFILGKRNLNSWQKVKFGLRAAWTMLWNRTVDQKVFFLPKKAIDGLRGRAQNDLASLSTNKDIPFISDGDILSAWLAKILSRTTPRPISVIESVNLRPRFAAFKNKTYMGNMLTSTWSTLPAQPASLSLGQFALQHRNDIVEQLAEPQLLATLRFMFDMVAKKRDPQSSLLCCPSDATLLIVSNWAKADFFKVVNFEAAVTAVGDTSPGRKNPPGTLTFHVTRMIQDGVVWSNVFTVLGKDLEGNYWLSGMAYPSSWPGIEQAVRELA